MRRSAHLRKEKKECNFTITSLSILILALLTISPASAAVNSWEISPENPALGDTLHIKGTASPGEEIEVQVTFEKAVQASGGKYGYILEDVKIPEGFKNRFTVQASEAANLNVRVKMLIWITKSSEASGNIATVTQSSVPPGTYQIKMDGDAREETSTVNLKITAVQQIKADSDGYFSYSYNTKAVPPGDFKINVGGITKKVTLQEKTTVPGSGFSFEETESSKEQTSSGTQEETGDTKTVLNPKQSTEQAANTGVKEVQQTQPVENAGLSMDIIYIMGGMGAAVLVLFLYSKRMKQK